MANHELSTTKRCGLAEGATTTLYCNDPSKICNGYNVCSAQKNKYNRPDQKFSEDDYYNLKEKCFTGQRRLSAADPKKCMANIKQENAAAKWQCGKVGNVEYYCIGNNVCDSKSNKCSVTKEGVRNADKKYSPQSYKAVVAKCEAKAKKIADCKSKIMTEDNDAHRFRCGLMGGKIYYCLANNYCSTAYWCAQTALHRKNAKTKYSPSAYEKELKKCEA